MQLLTSSSEEGDAEGFGWIPAATRRFDFAGQATRLRVPHVGWNVLKPQRASHLLEGLPSNARFYFTHSYFVRVASLEHSIAQADYGIQFDAVINRDHIWGTQFHPEKSHSSGLKLIQNFLSANVAS
jgi:glutamine amidotransferase